MALLWPMAVLPVPDLNINPEPRNVRGPASIANSSTQIISSDAGFWVATLGAVVVNGRNAVLAWRAIQVLLQGGLNPVLIPFCRGYQPVPDGFEEDGFGDPIPHSDGSFFSDGSGYRSVVINVTVFAAALAGAVQVQVTKVYAGTLEPGQHFSIGERLYRIASVVAQTASAATMTIWPPLRDDIAAGAVAEFDSPVCRMRMAEDRGMDLNLILRRRDRPSVVFVEDLP